MKRIALRFPAWARLLFSAAFTLSLITGLMWFYLDQWGEVEGEFGPEKHPWLASLAKVHGAGAFIAMISFGSILGGHVPAGWSSGLSRKSGLLTLVCMTCMVISAWGLYYAGSDDVRGVCRWAHLGSGLMLPVTVFFHVVSRRQRRRNRHEMASATLPCSGCPD